MPKIFYITDDVVQEIVRAIAAHPPERGGALLDPPGLDLITNFIFDNAAQTSSSTYHPSIQLTQNVQEVELRQGLELKGIIHSHPGGLDHPSTLDEVAILEGLKLNPHIPCFLAPIISTKNQWQALGNHELPLNNGKKISFYAGYRRNQELRVEPVNIQQISKQQLMQMQPNIQSPSPRTNRLLIDLQKLCQDFHSDIPPETFITEYEGQTMLAGLVKIGNLELLLLASESYPIHKPILFITATEGNTEEVDLPWLSITLPEERLSTAIKNIISGNSPYRKVYGTKEKPALTTDPKIAELADWKPSFSGIDPDTIATEIQQELFARSGGVLSQHISKKCVLVVGTGSVGSYMPEQLVRSGVGNLILIDPETVETANLCRTSYDIDDLGCTKVKALAKHLLNINPKVKLTLYPQNVSDFTQQELATLVTQADLVIAATDDVNAQRILNHFAYHLGKPVLFVGLYQGAEGGEVIFTIPNRTPCYLCATGNRQHFEQVAGSVSTEGDYGSNGRVMSEVAISADIHHVSSVAVKMGLSLLLPEDAQVKLQGFLNPAIEGGFNNLTMSMVGNYWFYPSIFGDTCGQYAYQSVWLTAKSQEECPVCGSVNHRVDPLTIPLRTPQAGEIRAALNHRHS